MASDSHPRVYPSALVRAAARLESALAAYRAARVPDYRAAYAMTEAFAALMQTALPEAGADVHAALVTLCATETARARAAAAMTVPQHACRILDITAAGGKDATASSPQSHEPAPLV